MTAAQKHDKLKAYIQELGGMAIAFSGGVDSTFLLKTAHDVLGDKAIAVTGRSRFFPKREHGEAEAFCLKEGITHIVCDIDELGIAGIAQNPPDRCYLCKRALLEKIWAVARAHDLAHVAEGSNVDDTGDYRPGLIAVTEQAVKSPLRHVGLTKAEIRLLSKQEGLSTWDKPSFACLATRFPYGEEITPEKLAMIDRAEQLLLDIGIKQARVRLHGNLARIETDTEGFALVISPPVREKIHAAFKEIGFAYTALDLLGYRTGSMNETLDRGE